MTEPDDDRETPAERRVAALLGGLRSDDATEPRGDLPRSVVRSARWQRVAAGPLRLAGALAGALAEGLGLLARSARDGRR